VQDNLFTVELVIYHNIHIVFFLRYIYGHVHALTEHFDGNGLAVVLIIEEQREFLPDLSQLIRYECERYLHGGVPVDVICALELNLSEKLLERICRVQTGLPLGSLDVQVGFNLSGYLLREVSILLRGNIVRILGLAVVDGREPARTLADLLLLTFLYFLGELFLINEGDGVTVWGLDQYTRW